MTPCWILGQVSNEAYYKLDCLTWIVNPSEALRSGDIRNEKRPPTEAALLFRLRMQLALLRFVLLDQQRNALQDRLIRGPHG
jgi:hypothetical protein